jgi:3-oxoacyl-[acyl-carrier protein] reductase
LAPPPLSGRTALVTGANHGIGAAIAVELARLGADIFVTFLRAQASGSDDALDEPEYEAQRRRDSSDVLSSIESHSVQSGALEIDLTGQGAVTSVFDRVERELGEVAILVNNASGWLQDTFSDGSDDGLGRSMARVTGATFDSNFGVDARAGALLISEFAQRHIERKSTWGRIVGLSSGGPSGFPTEVSYGAAKAALENYTMSAAAELAGFGITANIVHPPITDTGWITDDVRKLADRTGSRVVAAEEVAEVVGWLCTDAARLVTGNRIQLR